MCMELSISQRKAVTFKKDAAYRLGNRGAKTRILSEQAELIGWIRDHIRAAIQACRVGPAKVVTPSLCHGSALGHHDQAA